MLFNYIFKLVILYKYISVKANMIIAYLLFEKEVSMAHISNLKVNKGTLFLNKRDTPN